MATNEWFKVDKSGLAQVYARRGPAAPFHELISNAWDEPGVTEVELTVTAVPGKAEVEVFCKDDSTDGFVDLEEARVLFAPSKKKTDAERRGRFNVGEKLFLSLCSQAVIRSTGGSLHFKSDGKTRRSKDSLERGTEVEATMRMARDAAMTAFEELGQIISPDGIDTYIRFVGFDGDVESVLTHERFASGGGLFGFRAKLQSELADGEGVLRPTERTADVQVWKLRNDERLDRDGFLYEMGIPVVEIGGPFDVNVQQKVPLTVDRDNVRPAFLRRLRAEVLNNGHAHIETQEEADEAWVTEAMGSNRPKPTAEAMEAVLDRRFGRKRVSYDPNDIEGTQIAVSKGYAVVHGGSLPAEAWANVRATETIKPAGQVTPSSRAVFSETGEDVSIERENYPPGGIVVCDLFMRLARELVGEDINVRIVKRLQSSSGRAPAACYGSREVLLNLRSLGKAWFARALDDGRLSMDHVELLVHELGHYFESSHLSEGFHESQTKLGVKLAFMAVACGIGADLFDVEGSRA